MPKKRFPRVPVSSIEIVKPSRKERVKVADPALKAKNASKGADQIEKRDAKKRLTAEEERLLDITAELEEDGEYFQGVPLKNKRHELFCRLFSSDREFFCNGTQSYIQAYDIDAANKGSYAAARANASELLTKTNISLRISEIMDLRGMNDVFVDKELLYLVTQKGDNQAKLGAIKEYNVLKKRIDRKSTFEVKGSLAELAQAMAANDAD